MKNSILKTILLPFLLLLWQQSIANSVIVKGYVRYANGAVASGWLVTISIDSSLNTDCVEHHNVHTNQDGFYIDTLTCNGDIGGIVISTYNCDGSRITHIERVSTSVIENNFTICNPIPPCNAEFTTSFDSVDHRLIYARAGTNAYNGDSVLSRTWSWGDGDTLTGNTLDPTHEYRDTGHYSVCLSITTREGCKSSFCQYIAVEDRHVACSPVFQYSLLGEDSHGFGVRFNSSASTVADDDSIVGRRWDFGDGHSEDGNRVDPTHYYESPGNYSACVTINTSLGCTNTFCADVIIPIQHDSVCTASFRDSVTGHTSDGFAVRFNSSTSTAADGDSIIERVWQWGDGTADDGNRVDPTHFYKEPGVYNACLTIKTRMGCEHSLCDSVIIPVIADSTCSAIFQYAALPPNDDGFGVKFTSALSKAADGDTIIQRSWRWGDGTADDGDHVDPTHYYKQPGTYQVCLTIKSLHGCENTYCEIIAVDTMRQEEAIRIVSIYPNPVSTRLSALVYSRYDNVSSGISIYDIYGQKKYSETERLNKGNNIITIYTGNLVPGPYFLNVTTLYGKKSRLFFKR